jgi:hypothetical protein
VNYDDYIPPRRQASMVLSTDFSDVKPIHIQGAFREIHDALRVTPNNHAESALEHLRKAADAYVQATTNSHGF